MLVLTVVDQGASSLTSFVLAILVAHYSGPKQLGVFALLTSTYLLGQGAVRGLTSDCLLTRAETGDELRLYERSGYVAVLMLSSVLGVAARPSGRRADQHVVSAGGRRLRRLDAVDVSPGLLALHRDQAP